MFSYPEQPAGACRLITQQLMESQADTALDYV